jgi:hypothetical protein
MFVSAGIGVAPACAQSLLDAKLIHASGGPFLCDDADPTAGFVNYACEPLEDNNTTTGWDIVGTENLVHPISGEHLDTGGMMLLEFETEREAASITLDLKLRVYNSNFIYGQPAIVMSADRTLSSHEFIDCFDDSIYRMTGSFDSTGNTFSGRPTDTIDQIRLPGNRYEFLIWGPNLAALHSDGPQGLQVLEAHLQYLPVPEPSAIALLGISVLGLLGCAWWRRKHES